MGAHQRFLEAQLDKADAQEMQYRRAYNAAYNESEAALAMFGDEANDTAVCELANLIEAKANNEALGVHLRMMIQAHAVKEATRLADEAARAGFKN
jgi:hypothetical protein